MHIQILSDLHLEIERQGSAPGEEFYSYDFPAESEMLALLGDIGCVIHSQLFDWLGAQLKRFSHVFFVMGNHGDDFTCRPFVCDLTTSHPSEPYGSTVVS